MNEIYQDILRRVEEANAARPTPLRSALTDLLINHPATQPHDQCGPANKKMIRYKLANGMSLGHEIENGPQHLWFRADHLPHGFENEAKLYPPTQGGKGRHANVNQMPDLRDEAVARLTIKDLDQAVRLLNGLLGK